MESESSAKIAARSENRAATQADSDTSSTRSIERDP
jgi:hypothetical protein